MRGTAKQRRGEGGQVLALALLGMTVVMGFVAMTIDVGFIYQDRRGMQNSADAAALAGVSSLPLNPAGAISRARQWAQLNGYTDGSDGTSVKVVTPYNLDPSKIEVTITRPRSAVFARVLGLESFTVTARAVASKYAAGGVDAAFLVLNPTKCQSFNKTGSSTIAIVGPGGIMDNSACNPSIDRTGSGSVVASAINYYQNGGGYTQSGSGQLIPAPTGVANKVPDPLANTTPPDLTLLGPSIDSGGTPANPSTKVLSSGPPWVLHPGVYYGGIQIKSTANVTFLPGTYVMAGSGLQFTGSGTVAGAGVTIYNTFDPQKTTGAGACNSIDIGGAGVFTFTGPISGAYKNIVFWQDKACSADFKLAGGGGGIGGVIYIPSGKVNLSGGGTLGSIQVISDTVDISGTGDLSVNFVPYISIPLSASVKLVE